MLIFSCVLSHGHLLLSHELVSPFEVNWKGESRETQELVEQPVDPVAGDTFHVTKVDINNLQHPSFTMPSY